MRKLSLLIAIIGFCWAFGVPRIKAADAAKADAPKLDGGGVYPNDLGPKTIDVSKYPEAMQKTYTAFTAKCSACHTIARPINSQFLELNDDEMKKAKAEEPELFADKNIVDPQDKIWSRYVKRMMSKPGCPVGKDGKAIWEFLVYDSKARKTGANRKAWIEQRKKLLVDFKKSNPEDYKRLFADGAKSQ